ncbi:MAG: hypothetical protein Q7S47_00985, partial [bacterium]|nr:hypothetical protein [bacterium]
KSKHRALVSPYIIREETELTSIHDEFFVKVSKSVKEKEPDPKKQYDALMQAYFDHTGDFGKTLSPRDAGALLAYRVATEMGVTTRLKNGSDVFLKNMTHAPITDALLREVLILKKGAKPGFKNVSEMGGALKPMEGYEFDVRTNTKGEMTVKLLLRGKQYDIDLDKLKDLAKYGKDVLAKVKATATAEKK